MGIFYHFPSGNSIFWPQKIPAKYGLSYPNNRHGKSKTEFLPAFFFQNDSKNRQFVEKCRIKFKLIPRKRDGLSSVPWRKGFLFITFFLYAQFFPKMRGYLLQYFDETRLTKGGEDVILLHGKNMSIFGVYEVWANGFCFVFFFCAWRWVPWPPPSWQKKRVHKKTYTYM